MSVPSMFQCEICRKSVSTSQELVNMNGMSICRTRECFNAATNQTKEKTHACNGCHKNFDTSLIPFAVNGKYYCGLSCSLIT